MRILTHDTGVLASALAFLFIACLGLSCNRSGDGKARNAKTEGQPAAAGQAVADGPANPGAPMPQKLGDAARGKDVFRFETFGDEGFWTDAMRMPKGMADHRVTPLDALKAGLVVDIDAVPADLKETLAKELKSDLTPQQAPALNDPETTTKLIEANAVPGIIPKGKDRVGIACALCHTVTDHSAFQMPNGGSIGHRIDGPANPNLNLGKLLAIAANSRAYYPGLQLELGGKSVGRAPKGLTADSTEEEVDAFLRNPKYYPIGTFDDTPDGNGNSVVIQPLFRQDLAAPYLTPGAFDKLEDFSNTVYTLLFDPTNMLSPEGRQFMKMSAGPIGEELVNNYEKVLKDTGVTGYPFVKAAKAGKPGEPATMVGLRVDEQKLLDLNAYVVSLPAPKGAQVDQATFTRGRELFRANCTRCHNVDQGKPVPTELIDIKTIWPDYQPEVIAQRKPPLDALQNSPGNFDDKQIVLDASIRGGKRGIALPMLLDLDRKHLFLHDGSVRGLDALLDPSRGSKAPHPFYLPDKSQRDDVAQFLRGSDTERH